MVIELKNILYENKTEPIHTSTPHTLGPQPHLHKEIEIIYVLKGESDAYADRKYYHIKSGDIFISFPNQVHYYEGSTLGQYYLIILNPETIYGLKEIMYDNIPLTNVISLSKGHETAKLLRRAIKAEGRYSETLKAGYLNQVFGVIMSQLELTPRIKTDHSTLKDILKYCTNNFAENISLDDVSANIHLNKYHISHLFNEKLGINFNSYINMLRISKACSLLEDTDKKTADISEEVGFGSIRSFNRAFLKIMNTTPIKYRENFKN